MVSEKESARRNAKRNAKRKQKRLQKEIIESKVDWFDDKANREDKAANKKVAVEWRLPNR